MSKYLISTTEVYRADTEEEAEALISEAKNDGSYELKKYNCAYKDQKQKGEVIQEWYQVSLLKSFTDEKEPDKMTNISYE